MSTNKPSKTKETSLSNNVTQKDWNFEFKNGKSNLNTPTMKRRQQKMDE